MAKKQAKKRSKVKSMTRAAKRAPARKTARAKPTARPKASRKAKTRRAAAKPVRKAPKVAKRAKAAKAAKKPAAKKRSKAVKPVATKKAPEIAKKAASSRRAAAPAPAPAPAKKTASPRKAAVPPPARLQRERRVLSEVESGDAPSREDSRLMNSARSGHDDLRSELKQHTEASPALTAGDVDAKWQDAYALGDEAPGGDNMTPDQDRVDDIGKALGVEYDDDQELMGGEEIAERDENRWELDPASKEEDED